MTWVTACRLCGKQHKQVAGEGAIAGLCVVARAAELEDQITDLQARNSELVTQRRAWQRAAETLAGDLLKVQVGDGGGAIVLALAHFCAAIIEEP
jgi:hypothetical protein